MNSAASPAALKFGRDAPALSTGSGLRFIVISENPQCYSWEADSIVQAIDTGAATLAGIIYTRDVSRLTPDDHRRLRYAAIIACCSDALRDAKLGPLAADSPGLDLSSHDAADAIAAARAFVTAIAPDFILLLASGDPGLATHLTKLARLGVWSHRFGCANSLLPQSAVLEGIQAQSATVYASLIMDSDEPGTLHAGKVGIVSGKPSRSVDHLCSAIVPWLRRTCAGFSGKRLSDHSSAEAENTANGASAAIEIRGARLLGGIVKGLVTTQTRYRAFRQQWNVGIIHAPIATVAGLDGAARQAEALNSVRWMPEEKGRFFADPFGYETTDGQIRILFELFDWKTGLGSIAMRDYDGRDFGAVATVQGALTHLSYPFVVRIDGQPHYVPEHSEARDVSAFAIDAHGRSAVKSTLMRDSALLDCTFIDWNHRLWMFALRDGPAKNTQLHLYFSDGIDGEWRAHPLNPIKTDVTGARPAGTPFLHDGRLFRPGQDCSTHYGRGTVINEIVALSETEFAEHPVSWVYPPAGSIYGDGLHTLSQVNDITLIDGARKVGRWSR